MSQVLSKSIVTEYGEDTFQLRLIKEEGVGLLTSSNDRNYLLLDSLDYWYDLIQMGYPKKKKCRCKNEWFTVRLNYLLREATPDYKNITVITTCTHCNKVSTAMDLDIDYSPTEHLYRQPVAFCEKPKISCQISQLSAFWNSNDLKLFLTFMFDELKLHVYCWFYGHPDGIRYFEKVTFEKAIEIITVNHQYLSFFFSIQEIDLGEMIAGIEKRGVYLKNDPWRKNELIELSSPTHMLGYGLLFSIHYCGQHLDKWNVVDKSPAFRTLATGLEQWLAIHFVTKRGKHCFDGEDAYKKFIAKKGAV